MNNELDKYYKFFNFVRCMFVRGTKFINREQIYKAIKEEWGKWSWRANHE